MNETLEILLKECEDMKLHGTPPNEIVVHLYNQGLTITESMIIVRLLYQVNLSKAKAIVSGNIIWASVVGASQPLHDEMIKGLDSNE